MFILIDTGTGTGIRIVYRYIDKLYRDGMRIGRVLLQKLKEASAFHNIIKDTKQLSVVDFQAQWCGPCRMMEPHWKQLQTKYPAVKFYEVDVDESPEIAKECDVNAMPTYVLFQGGKVVDRLVGANPRLLKQKVASRITDSEE